MDTRKSFKKCPGCKTGFMLQADLHPGCETCLGFQHAQEAMVQTPECPSCQLLPQDERQRRYDLTARTATAARPMVVAPPPLWFLEETDYASTGVASEAGLSPAGGSGSVSPFILPQEGASSCVAPLLLKCVEPTIPPTEGAAVVGMAATSTQMPACPSADHDPVTRQLFDTESCGSRAPSLEGAGLTDPDTIEPGPLFNLANALPDIIKWAAGTCGMTVPECTTRTSATPLLAGRFATKPVDQEQMIWPCVSDIPSLLQARLVQQQTT